MHFIAALMLLQPNDTTSGPSGAALGAFLAAYGLFVIIIVVLSIVIYWRIASKAGYPGAYSLLMLIPLVNLIVLILFAFTEWPVERELKAVRGGAPRVPIT